MTAVGQLMLVLGFLVYARCEVRARDPEVEQEEQEWQGRRSGGAGPGLGVPAQQGVPSRPPPWSRGHVPAQTGYKLSKKTVVTGLQWRCCPGHVGHNCKDTVSEPQLDSGGSSPTGGSEPLRTERDTPAADYMATAALTDTPPPPTDPRLMELVRFQVHLQLEGFKSSLESLVGQVGQLSRDVSQLRSGPRAPDARVDEALLDIAEVRAQLESQRAATESRLHSQHAMLHCNLTNLKTDVDVKLERHRLMMQVSLQSMNATLSELKQDQGQAPGAGLGDGLPLLSFSPAHQPQPSDQSALWDAIERLDNMVVNNTVKVGGLMEDADVASGDVQGLRSELKGLEKLINQTARNTQVLFMETGLEVEDAKVAVARRVEELAANVTQHAKLLQDADVDISYLYTAFYKNHSVAAACDCAALTSAVARLERGVANVTALANDNRLSLEQAEDEEGAGPWGGDRAWEPAVEALQRDVQQAKQSAESGRIRTEALDLGLAQLGGSVAAALAGLGGLREADRKLQENMRHLSSSFNSLLKDVIRHSDVLELLLGEEVLEFLEWPVHDQEANSVPALKEQLRDLQERLAGHGLKIDALLGGGADSSFPGAEEEVPSSDQPSPSSHLLPGGPSRERQLLQPLDGGDLWNLEQRVEELRLKVQRLQEAEPCASSSVGVELQEEVTWLKRGLEEHLRVFKNVFSNADVLAATDATVELDKLWQLLRNRDGKQKRRKGGEAGRGGASQRRRRDAPGVAPVPYGLSGAALLFVGGSPLGLQGGGVSFEPSLNRGRFYADGGVFTAPVDGIYLFVLTLDLRPGPAHTVLRRGLGGAMVSLHRQVVLESGPSTGVGLLPLRGGDELRLELRGGAWAESEDNLFTGLLLHRNT